MRLARYIFLTLGLFTPLAVAAQATQPGDSFVATLPPSISLVSSGGSWVDGNQQGTYRIVAVTTGWDHLQSRLYIQWIAEDDAQQKLTIAATTHVTEIGMGVITGATFEPGVDGVRLRVSVLNSHSMEEREVELLLGAKGRYTVADGKN